MRVDKSRCYKTPEKMERVFPLVLLLLSPDVLSVLAAAAAERPGIILTVCSGVVKMT